MVVVDQLGVMGCRFACIDGAHGPGRVSVEAAQSRAQLHVVGGVSQQGVAEENSGLVDGRPYLGLLGLLHLFFQLVTALEHGREHMFVKLTAQHRRRLHDLLDRRRQFVQARCQHCAHIGGQKICGLKRRLVQIAFGPLPAVLATLERPMFT